jgi:hypothetical protein
VDRQRRARALIGVSWLRAGARSRFVAFSSSVALVALVALSLSGCRNRKQEARQRAELTAALDQFKRQVGELQKQVAGVRARFDKLPEDLPGLQTVRDDVHMLEEVAGVENGRATWLSGELEKAFASGNKEEIEKVRSAIPPGNDGIAQVVVRVTHQLVPFERVAAQRRFFEALDAERKSTGGTSGGAGGGRESGAGTMKRTPRP